MRVDDRLRSAATSLRREVETQVRDDVPELSARRTTHRRRVVFAIGVVIVVMAGSLVAVLQADGSHGPSRVIDAPGGAADHFRIGSVPDGMVLQLASDGATTISEGAAGEWTLVQHYIRYNAAHDRADGILTIRSGPGLANADLAANAGTFAGGPTEAIEVRGHAGVRVGPAIAWQESPDVVVVVNGPVGIDELLNVADGLRPRPGAAGFDLEYVPAGYEALAEQPGSSMQTSDSIVWYSARRGDAKTLKLFVTKDTSVPLLAGLAKPGARLVDVRGHRAVVANGPLGETISWDEQAGLRLELAGTGLTSEELLAAASSTVPLTDAQWDRFGHPHSTLFPNQRAPRPTSGASTASTTPAVGATAARSAEDALGLTVHLPSGWTLEQRACPAVRTVTIVTSVTAKPLPAGCEAVSGSWVSVQRIPKNLTGVDAACVPVSIDDMPVCQAIEVDPSGEPNSRIERRFYAGVDAFVSIRHDMASGADEPTFTYSDQSVTQAVAAGAYPTPQSLTVAETVIRHALAEGCSGIADEAAPRAMQDCKTLAFPAGGVVFQAAAASRGSEPAVYYVVSVAGDTEQRHYRVLVQNHWDTERRWLTQSVTSITQVPGRPSAQATLCTTPPTDRRFAQDTPPDCPVRK